MCLPPESSQPPTTNSVFADHRAECEERAAGSTGAASSLTLAFGHRDRRFSERSRSSSPRHSPRACQPTRISASRSRPAAPATGSLVAASVNGAVATLDRHSSPDCPRDRTRAGAVVAAEGIDRHRERPLRSCDGLRHHGVLLSRRCRQIDDRRLGPARRPPAGLVLAASAAADHTKPSAQAPRQRTTREREILITIFILRCMTLEACSRLIVDNEIQRQALRHPRGPRFLRDGATRTKRPGSVSCAVGVESRLRPCHGEHALRDTAPGGMSGSGMREVWSVEGLCMSASGTHPTSGFAAAHLARPRHQVVPFPR